MDWYLSPFYFLGFLLTLFSKFDTIHILGGLGGCLTHELSNLNSLYQNSGRKMFIVSPGNVAFLLPKGRHIIRIVKKGICFSISIVSSIKLIFLFIS